MNYDFSHTKEKQKSKNTNEKFVLFQLGKNKYCIPVHLVNGIIKMPELTVLPGQPPQILGMFTLRGVIITVISLRKKFNLPSLEEENLQLISTLKERKQDHINWIDELIKSTIERRPFTLTTDPTKCKFGQWYYSYQTDNYFFQTLLKEFEEPHSKIHKIGIKVEELKSRQEFDLAMKVIEETKNNDLKLMVDLFDKAELLLQTKVKKTCIVIGGEFQGKAIEVDKVLAVGEIDFKLSDTSETPSEHLEYTKRIGKSNLFDGMIIELNLANVLN
ncbi:MAG: chemotaxis protein CheW [Ignavibacteria bacterium]|nr:chemotaxis protein CheW [Ignavibacteria bacterium]